MPMNRQLIVVHDSKLVNLAISQGIVAISGLNLKSLNPPLRKYFRGNNDAEGSGRPGTFTCCKMTT